MDINLARPPARRDGKRPQSYIPAFSVGAKCSREYCHGDLVRTPGHRRGYTRLVVSCLLCGREYIKLAGAYVLGIAQESEHNGRRGRYEHQK